MLAHASQNHQKRNRSNVLFLPIYWLKFIQLLARSWHSLQLDDSLSSLLLFYTVIVCDRYPYALCVYYNCQLLDTWCTEQHEHLRPEVSSYSYTTCGCRSSDSYRAHCKEHSFSYNLTNSHANVAVLPFCPKVQDHMVSLSRSPSSFSRCSRLKPQLVSRYSFCVSV